MIPKILAPGIACTKFKLDLGKADRTDRVFKVLIALILPTAIPYRAIDLATTYVGLSRGGSEFNSISAWTLNTFGFAGLVLLNVGVIVFQLLLAWLAYGGALRYRNSTKVIGRIDYLLCGILIIVVLFLPLFVETYIIASNFQVIFG